MNQMFFYHRHDLMLVLKINPIVEFVANYLSSTSGLPWWISPFQGSNWLVVKMGKNPCAMQETPVQFLGQGDPLEKGTATCSSILTWRIPWTIYSPWGQKESDTTEQLSLRKCILKEKL